MNFDIESAIAAHTGWRKVFVSAIEGCNADALKDLEISDHTQCVLGAWLHAPRQRVHADNEVFNDVVRIHKQFHEIAVHIIELIREGDVENAELLMHTDFDRTSQTLVVLMEQLRG